MRYSAAMFSRRRAALRLAAAAAAALAAAATAAANGRFPATVDVHAGAGDDQSIYLASTFGLLLSHDDGQTFRWICEDAIGYGGVFDPGYRVAADGTLFATTYDGLRISRDGGCTWNTAGGPIAATWIEAIDLGPDGAVWVTTAQGGMPNDVFVSRDNGDSFTSAGLLDDQIWWKSVVVAPSDAQRIYVTGYSVAQDLPDGGTSVPTVIAERSDDGGETWQVLPLDDVTLGLSPSFLVLAVVPGAPGTVFARSVRAAPPNGDQVYRSVDGGESWEMVLETADALTAFTIRGDGSLIAGTIDDGVRVAADATSPWVRPTQQPVMACATERGDGTLFSCGKNWKPDFFALGRSSDGQTWTEVLRFSEISGPLACPVGTVQRDTCEGKKWPGIAEQFGIEPPDAGLPPPDAGHGGGGKGCCDGGAGVAGWPLAALGGPLLVRRRKSSVAASRRRC